MAVSSTLKLALKSSDLVVQKYVTKLEAQNAKCANEVAKLEAQNVGQKNKILALQKQLKERPVEVLLPVFGEDPVVKPSQVTQSK